LGWGDTQLKVHLGRLASLELLWCGRGAHGAHVYELAWDGASEGEARLTGLIDPDQLDAHDYDSDRSGSGENRSGAKTDRSGGGRRAVEGRSAGGRPPLAAVAGGG
jgi:hypothetical protein